jgi:hypothetical protein
MYTLQFQILLLLGRVVGTAGIFFITFTFIRHSTCTLAIVLVSRMYVRLIHPRSAFDKV